MLENHFCLRTAVKSQEKPQKRNKNNNNDFSITIVTAAFVLHKWTMHSAGNPRTALWHWIFCNTNPEMSHMSQKSCMPALWFIIMCWKSSMCSAVKMYREPLWDYYTEVFCTITPVLSVSKRYSGSWSWAILIVFICVCMKLRQYYTSGDLNGNDPTCCMWTGHVERHLLHRPYSW